MEYGMTERFLLWRTLCISKDCNDNFSAMAENTDKRILTLQPKAVEIQGGMPMEETSRDI